MSYPVDSPDLTAASITDDTSPDVVEAITVIGDNIQAYEHAKEYDDINLWEGNQLSREGRTLRQADIEFDPNFCGVVIDAISNKLKLNGVTAAAGAVTDKAATTQATDVLNQIWRDNKLKLYYRVWQRNTCRDGDGYIVVWPSELAADETSPQPAAPAEDDETTPASVATSVNITYVDPRMGRMFYDPENPRIKRFFAQLWEVTLVGERKPRHRLNLFYPDRIEKYISKPRGANAGLKPGDFQRYYDPDNDADNDYPGAGPDVDSDADETTAQWPMRNPYGQIPAFHLRTDLDYGKPVHRNAFALQDAISKLIEMQMVTVEFSGYPQRYAIQEADSLGTQSIREDPLADHSPAEWDHDFSEVALSTTSITAGVISNETGSNYEANPGGMQIFKGFKEVSQFATADPNAFLEPYREFGKAISSTTGTPLYKFQGLGGQVPSGEALKIIEAPLLDMAEKLADLFGDTIVEFSEFALHLMGIDAEVSVSWANPATTDLMEVWQLVELKVRLGVPRDQAFIQAGVPEQQAQEWAKTYAADFALAKQEQGRAEMFAAQAQTQQWNVVQAKIANGVPQKQALLDAGYKETDIEQWLSDQADALDLSRRVALLGQIATATQALGAAANLGVLTDQQVQQVIISVLGDVLPADEVPKIEDLASQQGQGAGGPGSNSPPPDNGQPVPPGGDQQPQAQPAPQPTAPPPPAADNGFAARQADAQYSFPDDTEPPVDEETLARQSDAQYELVG